jgi:hypothetical protein
MAKRNDIDQVADKHGLDFAVLEPRDVLDCAFVGLTFTKNGSVPVAVYDFDCAARALAVKERWSIDETEEWLSYNASGIAVWLHDLTVCED